MRQKKHEIEERKIKAFRKLTHLVLRKQTEGLEKNQLAYRHSKVRLQDELQDDMNLHRHLHLHHHQDHGLNGTDTKLEAELESALLKASNGTAGSTLAGWQILLICGLCVVAIVLVVVIIVYATKAAKAKSVKKDYY